MFTGDYFRGYSAELGALLDTGIKVALIYGDRDYQCNCKSTTPLLLLRDVK